MNFPPPLRGRVREGGGAERRINDFDHAIRILQDVVIPEPHDAKILRLQPSGAHRVTHRSLTMLTTIDFDNQASTEAGKIGDIRSERDLSPKTMTVDLLASQPRPQTHFRIRLIATQFACDPDGH